MYCHKCGADISAEDHFCPVCGASFQTEGAAKKKDLILGRFTKNQLIGAGAAAVVIIILFIVLGNVFGGSSYQKPLDTYYSAVLKTDTKKVYQVMPDFLNEYAISTWYATEEAYLEDIEDQLNYIKEDLEYKCGALKTLTSQIVSEEQADTEVLNNLNAIIEDVGSSQSISEAKVVTVELQAVGSNDTYTYTEQVYVVKVDGNWKMIPEWF